MHRVPADLPLQPFVGNALTQICVGEHQVQFHFQDAGFISVEGGWELANSTGHLLDRSLEHREREAYRVHLLLGHAVSHFSVSPPQSFTLHFTSGHSLTVFDDSERYESFSVNPKGTAGVYI
jgi:hypothetical protein